MNMDSMPNEPIDLEIAKHLIHADCIRFVRPLYGIRGKQDSPFDNIVGLILTSTKDERLSILCFNRDTNYWQKVSEVDYSTPQDVENCEADMFNFLLKSYDEDELSMLDFDEGFFHVLEIMPPRTVGKDVVELEEEYSVVENVIPLFCKKDSHIIVTTMVWVNNNGYVLGYDPLENPDTTPDYELNGVWDVVELISMNEMARNGPSEVAGEVIYNWTVERYGKDNIMAIETKPS